MTKQKPSCAVPMRHKPRAFSALLGQGTASAYNEELRQHLVSALNRLQQLIIVIAHAGLGQEHTRNKLVFQIEAYAIGAVLTKLSATIYPDKHRGGLLRHANAQAAESLSAT